MVDELLQQAQAGYQQARQDLAAGSVDRALVGYHDALEKLLRWSLIRDGAPVARANDPAQVSWQDLVTYLDVRFGVEREACAFLSQMTFLRDQVLLGARPGLDILTMQGYAALVKDLFLRLFPRSEEERNQVVMRANFGRPRPLADISARPPQRAADTPVMVPVPPPPGGPAVTHISGSAMPPPAGTPAWVEQTRPPAPAPGGIYPALQTSQSTPDGPGGINPALQTSPPGPADIKQRAIAAGRRLQELRLAGLQYCPHCRAEIPLTSRECPQCGASLAPRK